MYKPASQAPAQWHSRRYPALAPRVGQIDSCHLVATAVAGAAGPSVRGVHGQKRNGRAGRSSSGQKHKNHRDTRQTLVGGSSKSLPVHQEHTSIPWWQGGVHLLGALTTGQGASMPFTPPAVPPAVPPSVPPSVPPAVPPVSSLHTVSGHRQRPAPGALHQELTPSPAL